MTDDLPDLDLGDPAPGPTITDAHRSLAARKQAAGVRILDVDALDAVGDHRLADHPGLLSGTDLDREQIDNFSTALGRGAIPLALRYGLVSAAGSVAVDGLLTGLELARLRRAEEGIDDRLVTLRGRLIELAEAVLHADDAGDVHRLHHRGADAIALAERVLEEIGR